MKITKDLIDSVGNYNAKEQWIKANVDIFVEEMQDKIWEMRIKTQIIPTSLGLIKIELKHSPKSTPFSSEDLTRIISNFKTRYENIQKIEDYFKVAIETYEEILLIESKYKGAFK
ncbi:MAG: hypothetical protein ACTSSF_00245 [Candidatus Heimdallarchaeaceae archaeon]